MISGDLYETVLLFRRRPGPAARRREGPL